MTSRRNFPVERISHGDSIVNAYVGQCGNCDTKQFLPQTGRTMMPPEVVSKQFQNKGWVIGRAMRMDRCPKCARKPAKKKPAKCAASEPRKMSRDDRRIVYASIDDHYLGEGEGYETPWTDKKIADDLKIPLIWVREVREEFFGDQGSNELYDEFLEQSAPIISDMKNMFNSLRVQIEMCRKYESKIGDLERMAKKIGPVK